MTVRLFEEVEVEDLGVIELQTGVTVDEVVVDDDLVKEVPASAVDIGSDTLVEHLPEGVVEAAGLTLVGILHGVEYLRAALVGGVVIEVTHDDDAHVRIDLEQRVHDLFGQFGCGHTTRDALLAATARGPVIDDHADALAAEKTDDTHLVTSAEIYSRQTMVGDVDKLEQTGVEEQRHVDSAGVRRIVVDDLQIEVLDRVGLHEVFEN